MSKKDKPQLPGPSDRWRPQIVVQPSPAPRDERAGCTHGFLLAVGAVRYGSWQEDSPVVYSRTRGGMHPNFTQRRGRHARLVRLVSNAVRARLLRVWSLYQQWRAQDFGDRWSGGRHYVSRLRLRALLMAFDRATREKIVNALSAPEEKEELWKLIHSTASEKPMSPCSFWVRERSARLEGRSPRSKSRPSSEAISLKPPASRAYEERTRYR